MGEIQLSIQIYAFDNRKLMKSDLHLRTEEVLFTLYIRSCHFALKVWTVLTLHALTSSVRARILKAGFHILEHRNLSQSKCSAIVNHEKAELNIPLPKSLSNHANTNSL